MTLLLRVTDADPAAIERGRDIERDALASVRRRDAERWAASWADRTRGLRLPRVSSSDVRVANGRRLARVCEEAVVAARERR